MADIVDMASGLEAEHLARSLARVARDIPAGQAGVCAECLEHRPRLVRGLCGFCRDGRVPPPSSFETPIIPQPAEECLPVVNPQPSDNFQIVSIRARDDVLRAIRERAEKHEVSLAAAALDLVESGIRLADLHLPASDFVQLDAEPCPAVNPAASFDELADGIRAWLTATVGDIGSVLDDARVQEAAAMRRADAAEASLCSLKAQIAGLVS